MGKKKHHDEHHGGAWKVAYADFVTAMMALFMVLWIVSQDDEIVLATSRYFQNPFEATSPTSNGVMNGTQGLFGDLQGGKADQETALEAVHQMAREFYQMLNIEESDDSPVEIEVTSDGLRVTVFDRGSQPIFGEDDADFTDFGRFVMQNLAWLVDRHNMNVRIDAHADASTGSDEPLYGSFELTSDRANNARRTMEHYALDPAKVERVTGYGSTQPLAGGEGAADNNRLEISLSLN